MFCQRVLYQTTLAQHTGVRLHCAARRAGHSGYFCEVTCVRPAPRELIDDAAPRRYSLMRVVEILLGYECVRFTQISLLGACRPVPVVAHRGGHGLRRIAQRRRSVGEWI